MMMNWKLMIFIKPNSVANMQPREDTTILTDDIKKEVYKICTKGYTCKPVEGRYLYYPANSILSVIYEKEK